MTRAAPLVLALLALLSIERFAAAGVSKPGPRESRKQQAENLRAKDLRRYGGTAIRSHSVGADGADVRSIEIDRGSRGRYRSGLKVTTTSSSESGRRVVIREKTSLRGEGADSVARTDQKMMDRSPSMDQAWRSISETPTFFTRNYDRSIASTGHQTWHTGPARSTRAKRDAGSADIDKQLIRVHETVSSPERSGVYKGTMTRPYDSRWHLTP